MAQTNLHSWSTFKKLTFFASVFFILSYICFDILDLDESNLAAKSHPVRRVIVMAEAEAPTEFDHSFQFNVEPFPFFTATVLTHVADSLTATQDRGFASSRLNFQRLRGYRVALPRSSPSDPFQSL
jgi:hypothetical protein